MKKILINAMMVSKCNTGLGVYALYMLNELIPKIKNKFIIVIIVNELDSKNRFDNDVQIIEIKKENYFSRNKFVKNYCKNNRFDIYYSLSQHFFKVEGAYHIITIHDLIPLKYPSGRIHQWFYYKILLPLYLKSTNLVVTVSEYTKNDIIKLYNFQNVLVGYCGNNYAIDKNNVVYKKDDYFIMVGIHYPYKNIHFVIETLNKNKTIFNKLYIIGNSNCKYGEQLKKIITQYDLNDRIIMTGYINDEEKETYYKNAKALIFASMYEGFGLPLIEAMSKGTPVICSDSSCLPEIAGDGATIFENNNSNSLVECIIKMNDSNYIDEMIEKGFENVSRFSWENSANKIAEQLFELL